MIKCCYFWWETAEAPEKTDPANVSAVCVAEGGAVHHEVL